MLLNPHLAATATIKKNSTHSDIFIKYISFFPDTNNYHEILTVGDGPAAFFDILAPPYHADTSSSESDTPDEEDEHEEIRECFFFAELNFGPSQAKNNIHSEKSNIVWLRRVKSPDDYYCDTELYLGPSLLSD